MIGKILSHFRIVAKIGEGGMGVVYRAEDEKLRRPVALKVLPPNLVGNEERRLRFLREARAAAAVSHPNIATIHEVGEADGIVFIAMELVEGPTLRERIGGRPLPIKDALRIATGVAEGLAHAHQAQVIHRDLKPDNIIVAANGHAKILDFGLAKLLQESGEGPGDERGRGAPSGAASRLATISGEMTREGKVLGTAAYMSPEQARGEPVDARSDIFSFGVTLYEMATGKAPFEGRTSLDVLSAIIQKEPVAPAAANPDTPPKLEEIICKCLEKDAADRYQHADELVVDLRQLRKTTDSGVTVTAARKDRRWIWIAGGAAAAVALILMIALALSNGGAWRGRLLGRAAPGRITSLAVLPLRNLAGDSSQDFFADGMTDELTTTLSRIRSLRVISSTSAMQYKRARKPVPEIAKELGVDAVIEGSVLRAGERVRVTAQLVEAATDRNLWAASYERDLRDVLALQAEVARAIADEIKAALTPEETSRLAGAGPVDPEAYQHYLAGRYQQGKRTTEGGLTKAIEEYKRSIEKDPNYAPAYAGLADTYGLLPSWSLMPPEEAYPRAKEAALKALEIDNGLAEAHAALALIRKQSEWDWPGAEAEYKRAIDLNPNYAWAHMMYGLYLSEQGRDEEAVAEMRQAQRLDPVSSIINRNFGLVHWNAHRYDQALAQYGRVLELDPHFTPALMDRAGVRIDSGKYEEGIAELLRLENDPSAELAGVLAYLARGYGLLGRKTEALATIGKLTRLAERQYVPSAYIALAYAGVGDLDRSLAILEKAFRERDPNMEFLKVHPQWDPLRSDPRFQDLLRRVGFPPD